MSIYKDRFGNLLLGSSILEFKPFDVQYSSCMGHIQDERWKDCVVIVKSCLYCHAIVVTIPCRLGNDVTSSRAFDEVIQENHRANTHRKLCQTTQERDHGVITQMSHTSKRRHQFSKPNSTFRCFLLNTWHDPLRSFYHSQVSKLSNVIRCKSGSVVTQKIDN